MKILVLGGGGFIGSHMINKLKSLGHYVCGVDIKQSNFLPNIADNFIIANLTDKRSFNNIPLDDYDEIYQFAADMGGAEYVFTGQYDATILSTNAQININVLDYAVKKKIKKIFFSSSACIYPSFNQTDPLNPNCKESSAYPALPDSEYGWEKLFSERLYQSYQKNFDIQIRIARYHNIYGPYSDWTGGREKAPAALCRKVLVANHGDYIDIFGSGDQTRSFLYIDDCIKGSLLLMESDYSLPINIGSSELISIKNLVNLISNIENKEIKTKSITGPTGVNGRCSDNALIQQILHWTPSISLEEGIKKTYKWIQSQIEK